MADQKVSDLPSLNGADVDAADLLYIVDSSAGSAGSKKITIGQYQLAPVSGGTANGVAYLNGSKVVTTGSGLVFDGTNLGVGTSSPGVKLEVAGPIRSSSSIFAGYASGFDQTYIGSNGATGNGCVMATVNYANSAYQPISYDASLYIWRPNGTERMRLDASGNLGIGTSSPAATAGLTVSKASNAAVEAVVPTVAAIAVGYNNSGSANVWGAPTGTAFLATPQSVPITLVTNATERARITSGGDLLVGTATTAGAGGITLFNNGSTGFSFVNNNSAAATGYVFESFRRSSVEIGSVTQNGTTAVLFNTTSDRRLKENIVPAPSASDVIDAIQIVSHDWKSAPDEHVTYGVVAQDLALVAPQAVLQGDDGDEIEKTWGVDYSKLVPMLIKEIQSLRARVAALESA